MTRSEFNQVLEQELRPLREAIGRTTGHSGALDLRESAAAREDRLRVEEAERKARKQLRKEAKRDKRDGRDVFESLGMPRDAAKLAAGE